jgi:hypothetical protein
LVPICISFATIIYRDPFFSPHLPMLLKLVSDKLSWNVHRSIRGWSPPLTSTGDVFLLCAPTGIHSQKHPAIRCWTGLRKFVCILETVDVLRLMRWCTFQVQDAGLIFLSAMASSIVQRCKALNVSDEVHC